MRTPIAVLAAALTLIFVELGLDAPQAQAGSAPNYCKHRYNFCLAHCAEANRRCFTRCQSQFRHCTYRMPYMGDLL